MVYWTLLVLFVIFFCCRLFHVVQKNTWRDWLDDFAIEGFSALVFVLFAYAFREEIYNIFSKPVVSLGATCGRTENDRKFLYNCKITLKNPREASLSNLKIVLESSAKYSNFNFSDCSIHDLKKKDNDDITSESTQAGLADCKFKVTLGSFSELSFNLTVNGDQNDPDIALIQ